MERQITEADVGKRVVYDGDSIGELVDYRGGTAYVAPDPDITDILRSTLDWASESDETFPLQRELVDEVADDEVRLVAEL